MNNKWFPLKFMCAQVSLWTCHICFLPLQFPFSIFTLFFACRWCVFLSRCDFFSCCHIIWQCMKSGTWYGKTMSERERIGQNQRIQKQQKMWTAIIDYLVNLLAIFNKFEKCVIFLLFIHLGFSVVLNNKPLDHLAELLFGFVFGWFEFRFGLVDRGAESIGMAVFVYVWVVIFTILFF